MRETQADADAGEATFRSVLLALQADVEQTWFRLRAADAELGLLRDTVRLREENVRINGRRFEPELALTLLVAPVLLDAAYDASLRDLKDNWLPLAGLVLVVA